MRPSRTSSPNAISWPVRRRPPVWPEERWSTTAMPECTSVSASSRWNSRFGCSDHWAPFTYWIAVSDTVTGIRSVCSAPGMEGVSTVTARAMSIGTVPAGTAVGGAADRV